MGDSRKISGSTEPPTRGFFSCLFLKIIVYRTVAIGRGGPSSFSFFFFNDNTIPKVGTYSTIAEHGLAQKNERKGPSRTFSIHIFTLVVQTAHPKPSVTGSRPGSAATYKSVSIARKRDQSFFCCGFLREF